MQTIELTYRDKKMFIPAGNPEKISLKPIQMESDIRFANSTSKPFFVLYVTDECNMNCKYCFANANNKATHNHSPQYTYKDFFEFLVVNDFKDIDVRFFGGEPLLNIEWIIGFVDFFSKKNIKIAYQIFTNLTLLDADTLDFLTINNIRIFASIDTISNARIDFSERFLLEQINRSTDILLEKGVIQDVYIRFVVQNGYDIIEQIEWFFKRGFKFISLTLPWATQKTNELPDKAFLESTIDLLVDYYILNMMNRDIDKIGIHPIVRYLTMFFSDTSTIDKRQCGSGVDLFCVSTDSRIYPCHAFNGVKEFEQGNIHENLSVCRPFCDIDCDTTNCKDCDIKYMCITKCLADSYFSKGDIHATINYKCDFGRSILAASAYIFCYIKEHCPKEFELYRRVFKHGDRIYGNNN
jgi:uncharacterized protein